MFFIFEPVLSQTVRHWINWEAITFCMATGNKVRIFKIEKMQCLVNAIT